MILLNALFWGRFHPLMVHLPIGFLLLGLVAEWFFRGSQYRKLINFIWFLGSASAILAALFGWMLASEGGYEENTLFWHRWSGILLAVVSTAVWLAKSFKLARNPWLNKGINVAMLFGLLVVGHLGGNLTHGSSYLVDHAPAFVQRMLAETDTMVVYKTLDNPDSVYVYADLIEPVLEVKCMQCHNDEVQRGGLNMATPELMMEGGDHGAVLASGQSRESELFRRLTLPVDHEKYMPLKGEPMTFDEVRLLEWWIDEGASFEERLPNYEVPENVSFILTHMYELDLSEKPHYEKAVVHAVGEEVVNRLRELGFEVDPIYPASHFLDVRFGGEIQMEHVEALSEAAEQITWLDLHNTGLTDALVAALPEMPNLTRLRLQQNPFSDEGLQAMGIGKHLESLNVYATSISDESVEYLGQFTGLKRLYVWQTEISVEGVEQLRKANPELEVDMGVNVAVVP